MASDSEVRARLLTNFYDLRHKNGGWVPASDIMLANMEAVDGFTISTVCQHLSEANLIDWKPLDAKGGSIVGMARIRGLGVDVVEGKATPQIDITLSNPRLNTGGTKSEGVAESFSQPFIAGPASRGVAGDLIPSNQRREAAARTVGGGYLSAALKPQPGAPASGAFSVTPTEYPDDLSTGTILVHNSISINLGGDDFRNFERSLLELTAELRKSNEIAGEVRNKILSELEAGMAILKSPKPDPKLIEVFLKRPLIYISEKATSTIITTLAATAVMALLKMLGVL